MCLKSAPLVLAGSHFRLVQALQSSGQVAGLIAGASWHTLPSRSVSAARVLSSDQLWTEWCTSVVKDEHDEAKYWLQFTLFRDVRLPVSNRG